MNRKVLSSNVLGVGYALTSRIYHSPRVMQSLKTSMLYRMSHTRFSQKSKFLGKIHEPTGEAGLRQNPPKYAQKS